MSIHTADPAHPAIRFIPGKKAVEAWWGNYSKASARLGWREFYDIILRGLPVPGSSEMEVRTEPDWTSIIALYGFDNSYLVGNSVRSGTAPCLYNDITMFAPAWQRQGYGTRVIINMVEVADALGLKQLRLHACERGPHAWTLMGFQPTALAWTHVRASLLEFIELMNGELEADEIELLYAILNDNDPGAIRDLRQLERVITGCPIVAFNGLTPMEVFLAQTGLRFDAVLDLRPGPSRDTFEAYCYGDDDD